eukprot:TRINITY_DN540_c0_g1_i1.p1 TRINITY_DN540_c0_g1~~TRINITY_DN540_c0_g1_i1.p1  ORF type:complete len:210 (-),score=42.62 TRINITY_DN540_c0_g1_i1:82-675(-)
MHKHSKISNRKIEHGTVLNLSDLKHENKQRATMAFFTEFNIEENVKIFEYALKISDPKEDKFYIFFPIDLFQYYLEVKERKYEANAYLLSFTKVLDKLFFTWETIIYPTNHLSCTLNELLTNHEEINKIVFPKREKYLKKCLYKENSNILGFLTTDFESLESQELEVQNNPQGSEENKQKLKKREKIKKILKKMLFC